MTPLRALLVPFHFSSIAPIIGMSLMLAAAVSADITGILWMLPAFMMTSLLFKYAFIMLEHIADGESDAPVVSLEMLGPFEQRPLFLLIVTLAIIQLLWWFDGVATRALAVSLSAAIPAAVGILGATRRVKLSINPVVVLQTIRGMGWWYLTVLLMIGGFVALTALVMRSSVWHVVLYIQIGVCVLMIFSFIGGVMYERRIELGHEPRKSPEHVAVIQQRERRRHLQRVLDEMYGAIRLGDLVNAMAQLEQRTSNAVSQSDHQVLAQDVDMIHMTIRSWNDPAMLTAASRTLAALLLRHDCTEAMEELIATTLESQPTFTCKSETGLLPIVHALQTEHRRDLALQLVTNFVNTFPNQVTPGITALMQRLSVVKQ